MESMLMPKRRKIILLLESSKAPQRNEVRLSSMDRLHNESKPTPAWLEKQ